MKMDVIPKGATMMYDSLNEEWVVRRGGVMNPAEVPSELFEWLDREQVYGAEELKHLIKELDDLNTHVAEDGVSVSGGWTDGEDSDDDGGAGADGADEADEGDEGDDGEQSGEQSGEQGDSELPEGMGPEQIDSGNPLADDLWPALRPAVVETADQVARYRDKFIDSGGGSTTTTIRISGKKAGTVTDLTHKVFPIVLRAVARGQHVYLPGEPGTGKSHMAMQVAAALDMPFSVTSFSPMSTESKLIGFVDANGNTVRTEYRERYEMGGIWVGDELDNSNPAVVAGMNSGLANGFQEFPDGTIQRHADFVCIATANTLGTGPTAQFAGRQRLDPATLDRFITIPVETDESMELALIQSILGGKQAERWVSKVRHVRRAVRELKIQHFVTMRSAIQGAHLIAPGDGKFTISEALDMAILAQLSEDQRTRVLAYK